MLLFKTSGKTFNNVIKYQKHAFKGRPKTWHPGEIILVSKNKKDCKDREEQIQYIMFLDQIRPTNAKEFEKYWPDNKKNWKFIADCFNSITLKKPFNILDKVGQGYYHDYGRVQTFKKINAKHEGIILTYLKSINAI